MDIPAFRAFCHDAFPFLGPHLKTLRDGRNRPRIGVISIFRSLFYGGILGLGSLLGLDQFLRTEGGKRLFGKKQPLVSDSTLSRSLSSMAMAPLRALLQKIYERARTIGPSRLPVGIERLRVGMIDGSCFGKLRASCFAQLGVICLMADLECIEKQGKELPASERLLKRLCTRFGKAFVDLLLLDGLYMAQGFIRCALSNRIDVLIKTEEETLDIIKDARGLMMHKNAKAFGVQIIKGLDKQRLRTYEVRVVGGLFHQGVDAPFQVAYVNEQEIKSGRAHAFFVLTTRQALTPDQIRELAHRRWDEENNGFKALNHLVHTKHIYAHDPEAQQAILFILMIAGNLLQLFDASIPDQILHRLLGKVKRTKRLIQQLLRQSIMRLTAPDT
jgi:hypothetical protein